MRYLICMILCGFVWGLDNKFLLNDYHNPNRLVFRLAKGTFECSLLGVAVPYYGNQCSVESSHNFVQMSHLSIGYFENNLNFEQYYSLKVQDGYCAVSYGNVNFSEKIIKDGYGVVNSNGVSDKNLLERLQILQDRARENQVGLWRDFYDEMECFKDLF